VGRRNECPNPSGAVGVSDWKGVTGAAGNPLTVTQVTGLGAGWDRTTGGRVTQNVAGTIGLYTALTAQSAADLSGTVWSATIQASCSSAQTMALQLVAYDVSSAALSAVVTATSVARTAGEIWRQSASGSCPAGTRQVRVRAACSTSAAIGATLTVTASRIEQVSDAALAFFDGASPGWAWDGTVGASTSGETLFSGHTVFRGAQAVTRASTY
jgi:hypothetical protein